MSAIDHLSAMQKALEQLKITQRNLCRGSSIAIQKKLALDHEGPIQALSDAIKAMELPVPQTVSADVASNSHGLTLGAMMARTIAQEKSGSIEAARRAAESESAKALMKFIEVQDFFLRARVHFEDCILSAIPTKRIRIQVGGPIAHLTPGSIHEGKLYGTLDGYQHSGGEINSLGKRGAFNSLWLDFQQWAQKNGLNAYWDCCHDGVGMESWWELRIKPAA